MVVQEGIIVLLHTFKLTWAKHLAEDAVLSLTAYFHVLILAHIIQCVVHVLFYDLLSLLLF